MTRILVDECLPAKLADRLRMEGHDAHSVAGMKWSGKKDSEILQLAEREGFDVILTADAKMRNQHNFSTRPFAVLAIPTNRMSQLKDIWAHIKASMSQLLPGSFTVMDFAGAQDWRKSAQQSTHRQHGVGYHVFK